MKTLRSVISIMLVLSLAVPQVSSAQTAAGEVPQVRAPYQPGKLNHFLTGNIGFMAGMYAEMLISARLSGDPMLVAAADDALKDAGGWMSLAVFSLTADRTNSYFMQRAARNQWKHIGPSFISNFGLVTGSLANKAFSNFWYSPNRLKMWKDVQSFFRADSATSTVAGESTMKLDGWYVMRQKIGEAEKLKTSLEENLKTIRQTLFDKVANRKIIEVQKGSATKAEAEKMVEQIKSQSEKSPEEAMKDIQQLMSGKNLTPEEQAILQDYYKTREEIAIYKKYIDTYEPLRRRFISRFVEHATAAFKDTFYTDFRGVQDQAIHIAQLLFVVGGLGLMSQALSKALHSEAFKDLYIKELVKAANKIPLEQLPLIHEKVQMSNGQQRAVWTTLEGKIVTSGAIAKTLMATVKSAIHATRFLFTDKQLTKLRVPVEQNLRLNTQMLFDGFFKTNIVEESLNFLDLRNPQPQKVSAFQVAKAGPAPVVQFANISQEERYKKFSTTLQNYSGLWADHTQRLILKEFNERQPLWQKKIDDLNLKHSRLINYLRWFARSYEKGQNVGRPENYLDMEDTEFVNNGGVEQGGIGWHEDPLYKGYFEEELKVYRPIFDVLVQQMKSGTFNTTDEKGAVKQAKIPEVVDNYLRGVQQEYNTEMSHNARTMKHYISKIVDGALFTNQEPWWLKVWGTTFNIISMNPQASKIFRGISKYNIKEALIFQFNDLKEKYLELKLPNSYLSKLLNEALLNPANQSIDRTENLAEALFRMGNLTTNMEKPFELRKPTDQLTREQRADIIAYEFAKIFSRLIIEYRSLPAKRELLIGKVPMNPELAKTDVEKARAEQDMNTKKINEVSFITNGRIIDPFDDSESTPGGMLQAMLGGAVDGQMLEILLDDNTKRVIWELEKDAQHMDHEAAEQEGMYPSTPEAPTVDPQKIIDNVKKGAVIKSTIERRDEMTRERLKTKK
ncbi:MAG: hypothetical protein AB7F59_06315 [Bdellovibrionales bacterium]